MTLDPHAATREHQPVSQHAELLVVGVALAPAEESLENETDAAAEGEEPAEADAESEPVASAS